MMMAMGRHLAYYDYIYKRKYIKTTATTTAAAPIIIIKRQTTNNDDSTSNGLQVVENDEFYVNCKIL